MLKNSNGVLTEDQRAEYSQLIYRIGLRYVSRSAPNHKGLKETARALGISYPTLKQRINPHGKARAKYVTTEQLMAARYLYDNPVEGAVRSVDLIPEPPSLGETMSDKIVRIVHDANPRPLNAEEILFSLKNYLNVKTTMRTVQNRLSDLVSDEVPMIVRKPGRRGYYMKPEWES